jgi:hypothetical protein
MSKSTHRSQRFAQAATTERNRLIRKRDQLSEKREDLQQRLEELDKELEAVDQEIIVLEGFTSQVAESARSASTAEDLEVALPEEISGGAIRALAVPMLLRERGPGPIHYVEWAELLRSKGLQVAGKRPDAVFLNQVVRSPLVRSTTKAGIYELDLEAPQRLEDRLRQEKTKLATLMIENPRGAEDFSRHREAQRELQNAIARTERELAEALTALADAEVERSQPDARAA